jgi:hypothetical protein
MTQSALAKKYWLQMTQYVAIIITEMQYSERINMAIYKRDDYGYSD